MIWTLAKQEKIKPCLRNRNVHTTPLENIKVNGKKKLRTLKRRAMDSKKLTANFVAVN